MRVLLLSESNFLFNYLVGIGEEVKRWTDEISLVKDSDFIVSYGYRHIIKSEIIKAMPNRIINLHISLLPWNRGAYPNVWSFIDDTPKGVTIHYIDEGIDTGDIICQKMVHFDEFATLNSSYLTLKKEVEQLFIRFWPRIKEFRVKPTPQRGEGSYHSIKDFEKIDLGEKGWDITIQEFKMRHNIIDKKKEDGKVT